MTNARRRPTPQFPQGLKTVHIVGVCGTAMAALAGMFIKRGLCVTGSDRMAYPPVSHLLRDLGVDIQLGWKPCHVAHEPDLVVVGNVCRPDNPEVAEAMRLGLPCVSLPEVLREVFMADHRGVVITGTHGKTTTSSILAWLLQFAGHDPSYLIGGIPTNFGSNCRLGGGETFVVEGDEYDTAFFDKVPKFWHYPAQLATINNIEFDHVDIYPDIESIQRVFARFAAQVAPDGRLWVNGDDKRSLQAAESARCSVSTFGLSTDCDLHARQIVFSEEGTRFELVHSNRPLGVVQSPMWGEHNLRNAMGAFGILLDLGVPFSQLAEGMQRFSGVLKRQEIKGEAAGVLVIDDFAHHPTAVRETLRAVRERYPTRRVWAIFEAKSNTSRRAIFQGEYPNAFSPADRVVLSQVWRTDNLPPESLMSIPKLADDIRALGKDVALIPDVNKIVSYVIDEVRPGDIVVGLSGSDFGGLHDRILGALEEAANETETKHAAAS